MEARAGLKKEGLSAHVLQTTEGHCVTVWNLSPLGFKARYKPFCSLRELKKNSIQLVVVQSAKTVYFAEQTCVDCST